MKAIMSEERKRTLLQFLDMTRAEFRITSKNGGYVALTLLMMFASGCVAFSARTEIFVVIQKAPLIAGRERQILEILMLILSPVVACSVAIRDERAGTRELILSKPPSSEMLGWSRFFGMYAALVLTILCSVLTAWVLQILFSFPEIAPMPLLTAGSRVLAPLLFVCGLSYALGTVITVPIISALVIVLMIALNLGSVELFPVQRITLTANHFGYAMLGLCLASFAIGGWEMRRDSMTEKRKLSASWKIALVSFVAGMGSLLVIGYHIGGFGKVSREYERFGDFLKAKPYRYPDLKLPTVTGGSVRLSKWAGKPVIVVFWSTSNPGGATEAAVLERAWRDSSEDQLGFAQACITDDPGLAHDIARAAGLKTPTVLNPFPDGRDEISFGLMDVFKSLDVTYGAAAGVIEPEADEAPLSLSPVSQSVDYENHPSYREWGDQLYERSKKSFRQYAIRQKIAENERKAKVEGRN